MTSEIAENQHRLKRQFAVIELLEKEFLSFLWADTPTTGDQLKKRCEQLSIELENAEGLSPALVLYLFEHLEQKAFYEVSKATALAQTIRPDDLITKLPPKLINVAHAVRDHAYKDKQSKQASQASKRPRPLQRHTSRQRVEVLLQKKIDKGEFVPGRPLEIAKFVNHVCGLFPELTRSQTVRGWVKEFLKNKHSSPQVFGHKE